MGGAGRAIAMGLLEPPSIKRYRLVRVGLLFAAALVMVSCNKEPEAAGSIDDCARKLYPSYNPKVFDECVAVCKSCQHGVTTTCSTSCTLKGAH
jgi:hypothetical protein